MEAVVETAFPLAVSSKTHFYSGTLNACEASGHHIAAKPQFLIIYNTPIIISPTPRSLTIGNKYDYFLKF
jgi:hypothetical protein